jgi:hypothetical protein
MNAQQQLELPSHEYLARLARENPKAFEALRSKVIESFIDSAPVRLEPRLRGLQFRVDCERRLSSSALGATVKVFGLMWDSFQQLNGHWQDLAQSKNECLNPTGAVPARESLPSRSAVVLEFRPRPQPEQE